MSPHGGTARLIAAVQHAGVSDARVLAAMRAVPRAAFVPEALRDQAYENCALPIGHGQTVSRPDVVAAMTAALAPGSRLKVLEVGTGSGYQAAILAQLSRRVYTVEQDRVLLRIARERLMQVHCHNVTSRVGDGWQGWPEQASFPRIIVTAAADRVPERLADQLDPGGVMVAPVSRPDGEQELVRLARDAETGGFAEDRLGAVRFVPLIATADGRGHRTD